jgi:fatty-acyl-CoA synthase
MHVTQTNELTPPGATPTLDRHPRRVADFTTLQDGLEYAAQGHRGMNFHDARGTLIQAYSYADLRRDALLAARRRSA